jgi:hypothetical protein
MQKLTVGSSIWPVKDSDTDSGKTLVHTARCFVGLVADYWNYNLTLPWIISLQIGLDHVLHMFFLLSSFERWDAMTNISDMLVGLDSFFYFFW